MRSHAQFVNAPNVDVREELLKLGMNSETATMAIPYVWFLPGTTDPFSPVTIMLVEGIQHRLRTLGVTTRGDGFLDPATEAAIRRISGPGWKSKPWITIVGDVLRTTRMTFGKEPIAMGHYGSLGDYPGHPHSYPPLRETLGQVSITTPTGPWGHTKRGSCEPKKPETLASFRALQHAMNRVAQHKGYSRIAEDGILGNKSVALAQKIGRSGDARIPGFVRSGIGAVQHCDGLAHLAVQGTMARQLEGAADKMGAPKATSPAPPKAQVIGSTGNQLQWSPEKAGILPFDLGIPEEYVLIGGAVGLALWLSKRKKRPTRKRTRRRRR